MKRKTYKQKLADPRWQRKRLQVLEARDWKCEDCGDSKSELHVHHKRYKRGKQPWEYPLDNFSALCWRCHEKRHSPVPTPAPEPCKPDPNARAKFAAIFDMLGK